MKQRPDFIVLPEIGREPLPYQEQWMANGIPDSRAHLIYDQAAGDDIRIQIYHWRTDEPPR